MKIIVEQLSKSNKNIFTKHNYEISENLIPSEPTIKLLSESDQIRPHEDCNKQETTLPLKESKENLKNDITGLSNLNIINETGSPQRRSINKKKSYDERMKELTNLKAIESIITEKKQKFNSDLDNFFVKSKNMLDRHKNLKTENK